jgi:putative DNA primase/helicase
MQKIKLIDPDQTKPHTWDIADAILDDCWTASEVFAFIKSRLTDLPEDLPKPPESKPSAPSEPLPPPADILAVAPFKCLGYNSSMFGIHRYYMPKREGQIIAMTPSGHNQNSLMSLAPLEYWERNFPGKKGANWQMATNTMFEMSAEAGIFDVSKIRGRGAWADNNRMIVNIGNKIICDGKEYDPPTFDSKFIYNMALPLEFNNNIVPLSNEEASKFLDVCKYLKLELPLQAYLLAGWCVGAPICGALSWRPHIWNTGEAGSGKSWVMNNIVKKVLGSWGVYLKSNTTEAFIRQYLKTDAMPVMIDEFESQDKEAIDRIKLILELARQASFEDEAVIGKGSAIGDTIMYQTRSMFMFSSINTMLIKQSDESRISVVSFVTKSHWTQEQTKEHFKNLKIMVRKIITPEFSARLRARTIKLINVINANCETFGDAATEILGTQRAGDQIGALIACAYSLTSDKIVTPEQARQWCEKQDWTEQKVVADKTDSQQCLTTVLQAIVKDDKYHQELSVAEVLLLVKAFEEKRLGALVQLPDRYSDSIPADMREYYHDILKRVGVKIDLREPEEIIISDSARGMEKIMKNTAFSTNWGRLLKRINGANRRMGERFIMGVKTQATAIPWDVVFDGGKDE